MTLKRILFLSMSLIIVLSCDDNKLDVDVSNVKLDLKFINLDSIVYQSDSVDLMKSHHMMQTETAELYDYYVGFVMRTRKTPDTTFYNSIMQFRDDTTQVDLIEREIKSVFSDLNDIKLDLDNGFRHLKYHLPKEMMPNHIVFINSLFVSNVFCSDNDIAVGLERYLGYEAESVKRLPSQYFDWVRQAMDKKFLEVDVVSGWCETHLIDEAEGNLASEMIRWGKILYLVHAAYPDKEIYEILRYNEEHYKWANENEQAFWNYLVNEKMLFDNDERTNSNLLNPGPTTPGLPTEGAPDRMGRYTGWRIVNHYMEQNDRTIEQLLESNYNDILQEYEIE